MLNNSKMAPTLFILLTTAAMILSGGCSSSKVPSGAALQMIGTPLDHAQVQALEKKLVGRPVQVAVDELGPPIDVLREQNGPRQWYIFRIDRNTLGKYRYVIETDRDRVSAIAKVEIGGVTARDDTRRYVLRDKVKGKRPEQCRKELGLGEPVLVLRSDKTHRTTELYDARQNKNQPIYYCIVRYNPTNYCEDLAFIAAEATTRQGLQQ